ncbi:SDR family oxidoreductase [Candidatus Kapabacteria bacterium]|nr:SDR family oxidoreductase [Candidatus Kapabacteria bacterium]
MAKILITGANGGFGNLTVVELISAGHEVAASMRDISNRNKANADQLSKLGAKVVDLDVTDDSSVQKGVEDAVSKLGGLDIVINNAGLGVIGMQEQFTADDWQKVFDINVFGVQRVTRASLPYLRKNGKGLLIYISSLLGRFVMPFYGPYNSSKWALEAMAENYRVELSGFGIETCIVEPGGFATSFFSSLLKPSDNSRDSEYGEYNNAPEAMAEGFGQALASNPEQKPELVAQAILNLVETEHGSRKFRTEVDKMGMGEALSNYNDSLESIMQNMYKAYQIDNMLKVKK